MKDDPKPDAWLGQKLTTEKEMSGLLSLVISRVPNVLEKGICVSNNTIEENYKKYIKSSDPIRAFYQTSVRPETGNKISKDEVYDSYTRFCDDKKLKLRINGYIQ